MLWPGPGRALYLFYTVLIERRIDTTTIVGHLHTLYSTSNRRPFEALSCHLRTDMSPRDHLPRLDASQLAAMIGETTCYGTSVQYLLLPTADN